MATRELSLILRLKDRASKELNNFEGKLDNLQPTFRKMAAVGTAGFAAVSAGVGKAIQEAGNAEKIAQNFETTFGKSTGVLNDFIEDFGEKFAFVESEMKDGASSIGFQLNAMGGIGKEQGEEITKALLTASGGLSDFFGEQVDVTQAARAMAKGLAGNRQQLIDMGYNVLQEDLENAAEAMGMNTDEMTKAQEAMVFTKLITEQTQGSIKGLDKTFETFTGQQRALKKATKETTQTLGAVFIPMATDLLKKIRPVVDSVAEWIKENPKLTKIIIIATGALFGLVAVLGFIGIILPGVITAIGLLAGPIGIVIAAVGALIAVGYSLVKNWEDIKSSFASLWEGIKTKIANTIDSIMQKLEPFLNFVERVEEKIKDIGSKVGTAFKGASFSSNPLSNPFKQFSVNDALITNDGKVVHLNPNDNVLAFQGNMPGGKQIVINIQGGTYLDREAGRAIAEQLGEELRRKLRI